MKLSSGRLLRKFSEVFNLVFVFCLLLGGLFAVGYFFPHESSSLSGRAIASDGDSIRIGEQRVRLLGIDAPELDQTCLNANGREWPCGGKAKTRIGQLLTLGEVNCVFDARDKYGRALAVCHVNGNDIGATMVREGLAISYNDYPKEEMLAHAQNLGIWSGEFISPRAWREGVRPDGTGSSMFDWLWRWFAS